MVIAVGLRGGVRLEDRSGGADRGGAGAGRGYGRNRMGEGPGAIAQPGGRGASIVQKGVSGGGAVGRELCCIGR